MAYRKPLFVLISSCLIFSLFTFNRSGSCPSGVSGLPVPLTTPCSRPFSVVPLESRCYTVTISTPGKTHPLVSVSLPAAQCHYCPEQHWITIFSISPYLHCRTQRHLQSIVQFTLHFVFCYFFMSPLSGEPIEEKKCAKLCGVCVS